MRVERAVYKDGRHTAILMDDEYNIIEPVLVFINWLELKGASPNTVIGYVNDLKVFFEWLQQEGLQFYQVKPAYIPRFIKFVDEYGSKKGKSPSTVNRYLATISSLYRHFEVLGGYADINPMVMVKGQRPSTLGRSFFHHTVNRSQVDYSYFRLKKQKKGNTRRVFPSQIETFHQAIDNMGYNEHVTARNKLIFRTLYETGFRISEVLNLRVQDFSQPNIDEKLGTIAVVDHGDPHPDRQLKTLTRKVPVGMSLIYALEDYVTTVRPYKPEVANIFVSDTKGEPLVRKTVESFFQEVSKATGIKITPHYLRHTHGTELAELGYDNLYISTRLGHKSVESTKQYTHLSLEATVRAYERFETNRRGARL